MEKVQREKNNDLLFSSCQFSFLSAGKLVQEELEQVHLAVIRLMQDKPQQQQQIEQEHINFEGLTIYCKVKTDKKVLTCSVSPFNRQINLCKTRTGKFEGITIYSKINNN